MATARVRTRRRQLAAVALIAAGITPVFNVLTDEASLRVAVQGAVDAPIIALLVGGYLLFVRDGRLRSWFRRLDFRADLALSSTLILALFLVGRATGLMVTSLSPGRFLTSFTDRLLVHFVIQMNRMIGTNVLGYFMVGVYHRPKAEERIFLFVDLEGSTQLAERLGSARYFELLRRFVDDLTEPVLETRGEIDQLPPRDSRSMPSARAWTSSSPVRCRAGDPAAGRRGDTMRGSRAAGQGGARGRLGPRSRSGRLTRRRGRMRSISPSRLRRRGPGR